MKVIIVRSHWSIVYSDIATYYADLKHLFDVSQDSLTSLAYLPD